MSEANGEYPPVSRSAWTDDQRLKDIFLVFDWAEKLDEPLRTEKLRALIARALKHLEHVTLPNSGNQGQLPQKGTNE